MELINQVCSLELAKQLKELGFKQESLFYYELPHGDFGTNILYGKNGYRDDLICSAYTVAELGKFLEQFSYQKVRSEKLGQSYLMKAYLEVMELKEDDFLPFQMAENLMTQPDISAKMLIYLKQNNLI